MNSHITSDSKTTRRRKGRSTAWTAHARALSAGLRVSLMTCVLAHVQLWGAGETRHTNPSLKIPRATTRQSLDAIHGPSKVRWSEGSAGASRFNRFAPLVLNGRTSAHWDGHLTFFSTIRPAAIRSWGMFYSTSSMQDAHRRGPVYFDTESSFQRAYDQNSLFGRGPELAANADLGRSGKPRKSLPYSPGVPNDAASIDPKEPKPFAPDCRDDFASIPESCRPAGPAPGLSFGGRVELVSAPAGGVESGDGASGHRSSRASPGQDLIRPYAKKLAPYFRICTSDMITPVPFTVPGTRVKACAMACKCDDGAFGIGLYTTKRLASLCSVAAEAICPWQIKTISPSSPAGLTLPLHFTDSQIVACRLLESRPWE